jgi:uncharacterized protein (TIGR00369 family)
MKFMPSAIDNNFQQRVKDSFARQQAMATLGIQLQSVEAGRVVLAMPYQGTLTQQHGFLHAGIISTALDSACGYAAFSLMPTDAAVLSIEFKVNLLSPARGQHFRFEAEVLKPGRTITVAEGKAYALQDDKKKLIASMTASLMAVYERAGIQH